MLLGLDRPVGLVQRRPPLPEVLVVRELACRAQLIEHGRVGRPLIEEIGLEVPQQTIGGVVEAEALIGPEDGDAGRKLVEGAPVRIHAELEKLLLDPEVDALEILTPHHLHADHAVAALEAGKHVSLQKPPARTLAELDRIAAAARRSGRTLRVFENFMFYPPHQKAKQLIDSGAIGVPLSVRIKTAAGRFTDGWEVDAKTQAWRLRPELFAACGAS